MTAVDYLRAKYQAMGIYASDEWLKTVVFGKFDAYAEMRGSDADSAHRLFVESLPEVLLLPSSVSELGVSISRAKREDVEKYYRMECSRLGLVDRLTEKATVRFL